MAVYDDWAVTVDLTIGDVQSAAPSISISSGNNASDVNFLTDVMPSVNNTSSQYYDNGSYSGWMNSSTYCSGSSLTDGGDNVNCSWLCPPWNETEDFSVNAFTPSAFFQVIIYSLYSVVFVLALVGNMVVCAVVFTSIRKWTVTNFFIVNMAAGDILMAFFCIPFTFLPTYVLLYWPFGATMCRIVSFSQAVSVFVSAYTMVAISSDRYLAIVYPLRPRMTRKQAKWIIVAVWLAAFATAMPLLLMSKLIIPENSNWHICSDRYICTEVWADPIQQTQYTTVLLLLQYCFPLAVLVFTYGRIGLEIWGKKTPGEAHQHRDLRLARSKRKMIKMMIIVVFFFAFCWLPFNLLQIIGDQYPGIWTWSKINFVAFACHWLAMSHSAYNPIIYCCFNSKFRQGFQVLAVRCGCRCLMESEREWNDRTAGDCDCCGARLSGTHGSAHGDHGCAPLQRVNTYTTCTGGPNNHLTQPQQQSQHSKNLSSCRVLLPSNHHHNNQPFTGPAAYKSSYSGRFQHQQESASNGGPPPARARCCSSFNSSSGANSAQRRYSPSSSSPAVCGAVVNSSRSASSAIRPQKFVFRTNFPTQQQQQSCQSAQQQRLLSGAGAGSPTSLTINLNPSGGNTTAESHI
ncbi:RYamide receptor-like isoform X2 [Daphnia pulex]|uniref:RYamide receptor-like isoform X2 n=1 Tax=Daphnia pulex TaxID=6669 RepID=UPI001EDF8426|nr:RYamide receptor-like isoform X2 [Daphnia pulex]